MKKFVNKRNQLKVKRIIAILIIISVVICFIVLSFKTLNKSYYKVVNRLLDGNFFIKEKNDFVNNYVNNIDNLIMNHYFKENKKIILNK